MDFRALLFALVAFVAIVTCSDTKDNKIEKRDTPTQEHVEDTAVADEMDKRIFRYGRGVFRYGKRAPAVFRYGKRGSLFRYGKREDELEEEPQYDDSLAKRVFRFGKRDGALKRIFRYGKRDGDDQDLTEEEKRVFRFGKREADEDMNEEKRVFRFGKREDSEDKMKRRVFRFGKRGDIDLDALTEEEKRIFRYGRAIPGRDLRVAEEPHVPFRFGEEE